jgi:hypothetical protein
LIPGTIPFRKENIVIRVKTQIIRIVSIFRLVPSSARGKRISSLFTSDCTRFLFLLVTTLYLSVYCYSELCTERSHEVKLGIMGLLDLTRREADLSARPLLAVNKEIDI